VQAAAVAPHLPAAAAVRFSWHALFLGPLALRLAAQWYYERAATVETARAHYGRRRLARTRG
jgi:hypothetical protein